MKSKIILTLLLAFVFGAIQTVEAQSGEQQKVQINKQKKFTRSNLTVQFVSLVEDSRCPKDTNCIWAGNAKIRIKVSKAKQSKTFELNTFTEPKAAVFAGYEIKLVDLNPEPATNIRINRNGYVATLEVSRLKK